jgi:excinuclease ABC subunit C
MTFKDQDIFGYYREGHITQVCILFIRQGKMVGQRAFPLVKLALETPEILSSLLKQYYDGAVDIPPEILLPVEIEDQTVLAEWLGEIRGRTVSLMVPKKGRNMELLHLAESNARNTFDAVRASTGDVEDALRRLVTALSLKNLPERIECFDISNIGGRYAVGSMVTFVMGKPAKEAYRRFRIRTADGADDYGMMYELLLRRLRKDDLPRPDLLMVDGGKGQLSVALSAMKDLGITGVHAVGIAKAVNEEMMPGIFSRMGKTKAPLPRGEDRIYIPNRKEPVYLNRWPAALFLLQRIRDEAHRFAVTYYRNRKEKEDMESLLDHIDGVGPSRKKALLSHFGDLKKIRAATAADLQQVAGIGKDTAEVIFTYLNGGAQ